MSLSSKLSYGDISLQGFIAYIATFTRIVNSESHVCGGETALEVLDELVVNNPHITSERHLSEVIKACSRKAKKLSKEVRQLLAKYRRSRRVVYPQAVIKATPPDCMNYISTEYLEADLWPSTGEILRQQYDTLLEVISVLSGIQYEEVHSEENLFSDRLRNVRSTSMQLLCEVYLAIEISNGPIPDRGIPGSVPLCMNNNRIERYERDYFLLHRIKVISEIFRSQYSNVNSDRYGR